MRIFLTGFMGSGKTEVGRLLADRLGLAFVDLDAEIERREGLGVPDLFRREGEEGFRRCERAALEACAAGDDLVMATGGGIVTVEANRAWMKRHGVTVWLNPAFETLAARLTPEARALRPLFRGEKEARSLWIERLPLYSTADHELRVAAGEPAEATAVRIEILVAEMPCAT